MDNFPSLVGRRTAACPGGKIGRTRILKPMFRGLSTRVVHPSVVAVQPPSPAGGGPSGSSEVVASDAAKAAAAGGGGGGGGGGVGTVAAAAAAAAADSESKMSPARAAPTVTPLTDIEGLYMTSRDVVGLNSVQGELMGAWLAVHAMLGYSLLDVKLYGRSVPEEIVAHTAR